MEQVSTTAERLKETMRERGVKQSDLVIKTGLSASTISRYLAGAVEPRQNAMMKLAQALNVTELYLWGYDVPKERTLEQKKNDELVELIAKLRSDSDLLELVLVISKMPENKRQNILALFSE